MPPTVMMTYNRPYLPRLAEKFGLKKAMDLMGFVIRDSDPMSQRIANVVTKLQRRSRIKLRSLKMSDFDNEVERMNSVYNAAWAPNWGFVPMDRDEFFYMARNLRQIVEPELVFIAEVDDLLKELGEHND